MTFESSGTGTGIDNSIPEVREGEGYGKKTILKSREQVGNENKKPHECEA